MCLIAVRQRSAQGCYVVIVVYFSYMFHLIQYRNIYADVGSQPNQGLQVTLIQILTERTWIYTSGTVLQAALVQT